MSARNDAIIAACEKRSPKVAVLAILEMVPLEFRAYHRVIGEIMTPQEKSDLADAIVNWFSAEYGIDK